MVELLPWNLELDVDSCGATLVVCCIGMGMPFFEAYTRFHDGFLSISIMVHKVFSAHPFSFGKSILLDSVGGDRKKF